MCIILTNLLNFEQADSSPIKTIQSDLIAKVEA